MDGLHELALVNDICAIDDCPQTNNAAPRTTQRPGFKYETEKLTLHEIRLVQILPGEDSALVGMTMQRVSLEDGPCYTALSYTWGSPPSNCPVEVNGRRFCVRKNLWRFLLQRRKQGETSELFWIDALCINQEDPKERTHQVDIMAGIYKGADRVLAWLGPEYADSSQAMHALAMGRDYWHARRRLLKVWGQSTGSKIALLCNRQYWTRLWVFQELMLAREIVICCGGMQLQWEQLEQFLLAAGTIDSSPQQMRRPYYHAITGSPALSLIALKQADYGAVTALELMKDTQHLKCSDVKDKVFGLLGVLAAQHPISADYNVPLPTLLNVVLREHHKLRIPDSLETVADQCKLLARTCGLEVSAMFDIYGQRGEFALPNDTDMKAFPLHHEWTGITLWWASFYGHDAVERLLFERNIVNKETLFNAAKAGNAVTIKLLCNKNRVNHDARDKDHRTPLIWAAECGHEEVVKLLLASGNVNGDSLDSEGRTPLSYAASRGHEGVVKVLLASGKVDVYLKDFSGRTALLCAVYEGREETVKLLLAKADIHVDLKDRIGRTPLSIAAMLGYEKVVKTLLATGKVDADSKSNSSRSPLSLAAQYGHEKVVQVLLATGKVDPNSKDNGDRTPLAWAALNGRQRVLEVLLATGKVDANLRDNTGRTPLELATWRKYREVATILKQYAER